MPDSEKDLIARIKSAVSRLEWSSDWLALDRELAAIDLLLYKLRQLVIQPVQPINMEEWLKEIEDDLSEETGDEANG